ncbi:MAG TPA: hypothetical protein VFM57_03410 [Thermoleophilaceae bacterium]|nr:hypothetical protein [Thermoleophilaceae bacterium]
MRTNLGRTAIDFGIAAIVAIALWALGLSEVAWTPFALIAIAAGTDRGGRRRSAWRLHR